jgi:hypothetical protein
MNKQFDKEHFVGGLVVAGVALFLSYKLPMWIAVAFGWQEAYQHAYAWVVSQGVWLKALLVFTYVLVGFFVLVVIASAIGTTGYLLVKGICVAAVWLANAVSRLICGAVRGIGKALAFLVRRVAKLFGSGRQARRSKGGPGSSGEKQEESPKSGGPSGTDPYREAVHLFGLDEGFDEAGLDSRFRTLMKRVHPDVAGPNDLAMKLNLARTLIKERRGWG